MDFKQLVRRGPLAASGVTPLDFPLDSYKPEAAKIHFGGVSGLIGTLSASWDGTTFTNIDCYGPTGVVSAGGSITAANDAEYFFHISEWKIVRFTPSAGTGNVWVSDTTGESYTAAIDRAMISSGTSGSVAKYAVVQVTATGDNAIVAAVTGKKIRVISGQLMSSGTVNAKWRSATTDITGLAYLVANVGYIIDPQTSGAFETAAGAALNLNLSATIPVGGWIVYQEV